MELIPLYNVHITEYPEFTAMSALMCGYIKQPMYFQYHQ